MNTKAEKPTESSPLDKKSIKKASTTGLPMVDLDGVLAFVEKIEGEGLQTLSQQEVAKRLGYAAQTSTPFYRRIVAAKLFGLIDTTQGVNLTRLALDYFKPTDEESKRRALITTVKNVVGYQGMIERFSGKRLPPLDILRNFIEREFHLTPETANTCADVFVRSVNRAALVKTDGTLSANVPEQSVPSPISETVSAGAVIANPPSPVSDDWETHFLTLDAKRGRRVTLQAPPVITTAELKRIQNWLAVQFHVIDALNSAQSEQQGVEETDNNVANSGS
jgi:hypothetical protein